MIAFRFNQERQKQPDRTTKSPMSARVDYNINDAMRLILRPRKVWDYQKSTKYQGCL